MINEYIQGLCTQINHDPTLTDLQNEVELLGVRVDSLIPPITDWDDIDKTNTFSQNKIPSIIREIEDLKRLSKKCHCTIEINALRSSLEMKIVNIPIGKCRDEVIALQAQIEIRAYQVKKKIEKLCQDLERQRTIMNNQVIGSTTNIGQQNLQGRVNALKTCLDNLKKKSILKTVTLTQPISAPMIITEIF